MKKTAIVEHQLDELVDTAVQHFWARILPADGAEKPWLHHPGPKGFLNVSYRDINAQAHCVAAYLMRKGLRKGDIVAIMADQSPFYLAVDLALQFLGAVNLSLPENTTMETLSRLVEQTGIKFIFVQKESVYLALGQMREIRHLLRETILLSDEVDSLDPEGIVTYDIIVNHGKISWREYADQLKVMKGSVVPTDVYSVHFLKDFNKLKQISYSEFLGELDEALAYFSSAKTRTLINMLNPESLLGRSYGLFAPQLLGIQTWCLPQGTKNLSNVVRKIEPDCAVSSPDSLQRLEQELVMTHLSREGKPRARLLKAMRVCEKRVRCLEEGKKSPIFNRIQYFIYSKTLFRKIRRLLGGKLKEIVCDAGPLTPETFAFFRNVGYPVLRPGKEA